MIPISLTFEGLYSYQKKQTINFQHLTSAGLFGIFGATGSGKSSILEAISFVLYGQSERLGRNDKRNYNMLNLKSNSLFISFDFLNYEQKKYRAERVFKRNKKDFEKVETVSAIFYVQEGQTWLPLLHTDAEIILGMSYANFKRTIIIPQGQFREFLELQAKDRTQMLMEIFHLERYDLKGKASELKKQCELELSTQEGKMQVYESYNLETLPSLKEVLKQQKIQLEGINHQLAAQRASFELLKELNDNHTKLITYQNKRKHLEEEQPNILQMQQQAKRYQKTIQEFAYLLKDEQKYTQEFTSVTKNIKKQSEELSQLQNELQTIELQKASLEESYLQLDYQKELLADTIILQKIQLNEQQMNETIERIGNGKQYLNQVEEQYNALVEEQNTLLNQIDAYKQKLIPAEKLLSINNWYKEQNNLNEQLKHIAETITMLNNKKQQLLSSYAPSIKAEKQHLLAQKEETNKNIVHLQAKISELRLSQAMFAYTTELKDGTPCPVCGSVHHPKVSHFKDETINITNLQKNVIDAQKKLQTIEQGIIELEKINTQATLLQIQITEKQNEQNDFQNSITNHQKAFIWQDFEPNNKQTFNNSVQEHKISQDAISNAENQIKNIEQNKVTHQHNKEKYSKAIASLESRINILTGEANQLKSQLKHRRVEEAREFSVEKLNETVSSMQNNIINTEKTFSQVQERYQILQRSADLLTVRLEEAKKIAENIQNELNNVKNNLHCKMQANDYKNKVELINVLNKKINVEEVEQKVQSFNIQLQEVLAGEKLYGERINGKVFNEEEYNNAKKMLLQQEKEQENLMQSIAIAEENIKQKTIQLSEKEDLQKSLNQLKARYNHLKTISTLLQGNGFVKYISSVYLKELCHNANIRFEQITKGQMSLQISNNNEFEVIDHLNAGKVRSVKTLSGGQMFQASLSLALSLAKSVQANSKATQNFFFIDEGFGTQDEESVQIVFDALSMLVKENRIVGIISHLKELKERIPISLSIENKKEEGSQIRIVYN